MTFIPQRRRHRAGARLLNALAHSLVLALLASLAGCSWLSSDKESKPAKLPDIHETLRIREVWSAGIGSGGKHLRLALSPASDGSRVFAAGNDGSVSAFAVDDGRRIWRVKVKLPLSGGPGVGAGHIVVGAANGEVVSLRAEDGHEEWRHRVGSEVLASPAVGTRAAYVRAVDGKLVALSLADGSQVWIAQQTMPKLTLRGTGAPIVDKDLVIAGFDNGRLAAYDARDGGIVWDLLLAPPAGRTEVERLSDLNSTVQVVGDNVYAVGYQGRVAAVTRDSGQVLWTQDISSYAGLGADLNGVYVAGAAGQVVAFDRASGRELWKRAELKNRDLTAPAPFGSSVVAGDLDGYLHWFDARTGEPQARMRADRQRVTAAPLVVNDTLIVQTDGGDLVAFRNVTTGGK